MSAPFTELAPCGWCGQTVGVGRDGSCRVLAQHSGVGVPLCSWSGLVLADPPDAGVMVRTERRVQRALRGWERRTGRRL